MAISKASIERELSAAKKDSPDGLFDIDRHLRNLSGQQNYMDSLKSLTGDIWDVSIDFWRPKSEQIVKCNSNIHKLIGYLATKETSADFLAFRDEWNRAYGIMSMASTALVQPKKGGRWYIGEGRRARDIIKTPWFALLRKCEKAVNDFIADVVEKNYVNELGDIDKYVSTNIIAINAVFAKHPDFRDIKKIFGCEINDTNLKPFLQIKCYAALIIDNYMRPAYDVRKKLESNAGQLSKIFTNKTSVQILDDEISSTDQVIDILEKFIVAKYRKELTGSNEHFVKLFMTIVGTNDVSDVSGARLMELMDNIDLKLINSNQNAYKFAEGARTMIRKMVKGEAVSAEESIKEIKELFETSESSKPAPSEEDAKENDIL